MKHKHIIRSLPLIASILGRKYGVQVYIGGTKACTNGNTIYLPSLPFDCDDTILGLVRGYTDHESAHVRDTDFQALKAANLSPLEHHVWNILEDRRVENKLADCFPGCRQNFQWLIKHIFLPENGVPIRNPDPSGLVLDWLLITVRSWDVPELLPERNKLSAAVEVAFPGLVKALDLIMSGIPAYCCNTQACIEKAREIIEAIKKHVTFMEKIQANSGGQTSGIKENKASDPFGPLRKLINAKMDELPSDIGKILENLLEKRSLKQHESGIKVAAVAEKPVSPFHPSDMVTIHKATTALRTRLQALLQSSRSTRNRNGYLGRLDTRRIHKLSTRSTKLFMRQGERIGLNTAVHILLDSSGSMGGVKIELASHACFAIASVLHGISGISLGVTTFPGGSLADENLSDRSWTSVSPILKHKEPLHTNFRMSATGGTPLDSALWWVMQQIHFLAEQRKIILLVTDGEPDSDEAAIEAINAASRFGYEVYGIGIANPSILGLLPETSKVIHDIHELAPAMFGILQKTLVSSQTTV